MGHIDNNRWGCGMTNYLSNVLAYLDTHYAEAADGLVEKPPSQLLRGEGSEKNFYILKIDLVGSTQLLWRRKCATYLKLAHTYLSTVDKIVCEHGADTDQTEYAGDSVLAYFPESVPAESVLRAAFFCRAAVHRIRKLDGTLASMELKCKVVLHYASLIVSRIGPRGSSVLTAIGNPIHRVAKMEKDTPANCGRATEVFYKRLDRENKKYLNPLYSEAANLPSLPTNPWVNKLSPQRTEPASNSILAGLLNQGLQPRLNPNTSVPTIMRGVAPPAPITQRIVLGYSINWSAINHALGNPLGSIYA